MTKKSKINLDAAIIPVAENTPEQQQDTPKDKWQEWRDKLTHAETPADHFTIWRERYQHTSTLVFEFNNETFNGYLSKLKGVKSTENDLADYEIKVKKLIDGTLTLDYSVIDDSQHDKQTTEHFVTLESKREGVKQVRISATELARVDLFKIVLLNCHGLIFYGNSDDLNHLAHHLLTPYGKPKPKIRALSIVGYDDKSRCFVFPKFAYTTSGKRIEISENKFFTDLKIRPFNDSCDAIIGKIEPIDLLEFITNLRNAYGFKGLLALGYYVSSLYSHIIFEHYNFYPFLSLYGDAHAGKSFVSRLLNRCLFVDSEGQTMTSANTAKAELRKISQKSSLVCAMLEGRKDKSRFDYDSILPLYNRNALYSRATTSQDNRTHDLALKAAVSFVWNHELFASKPAKERVISLHFADKDLNETTSKAWVNLNNYSVEQLASVGDFLLKNRVEFEKNLITNSKICAASLRANGVTVQRIADNHAIALAGVGTFLDLLKIDYDGLIEYTTARAKNKLETAKTENHLADYFFESIEGMTATNGVTINTSNELVVHLPTALISLQQNHNGFNNKADLIAELKAHDRFIAFKSSRCFGSPKECYHFKTQ
jgi:hypothetical protein